MPISVKQYHASSRLRTSHDHVRTRAQSVRKTTCIHCGCSLLFSFFNARQSRHVWCDFSIFTGRLHNGCDAPNSDVSHAFDGRFGTVSALGTGRRVFANRSWTGRASRGGTSRTKKTGRDPPRSRAETQVHAQAHELRAEASVKTYLDDSSRWHFFSSFDHSSRRKFQCLSIDCPRRKSSLSVNNYL